MTETPMMNKSIARVMAEVFHYGGTVSFNYSPFSQRLTISISASSGRFLSSIESFEPDDWRENWENDFRVFLCLVWLTTVVFPGSFGPAESYNFVGSLLGVNPPAKLKVDNEK